MLLTAVLTCAILLIPLTLGSRISYSGYAVVFFLQGLIQSGSMVYRITFVLDLAPPDQLVWYAGAANTIVGVMSLLMLGAGVVVQAWGLEALFALCLAFALASPLAIWRIRDPKAAK
jgi:hypothetical protein